MAEAKKVEMGKAGRGRKPDLGLAQALAHRGRAFFCVWSQSVGLCGYCDGSAEQNSETGGRGINFGGLDKKT